MARDWCWTGVRIAPIACLLLVNLTLCPHLCCLTLWGVEHLILKHSHRSLFPPPPLSLPLSSSPPLSLLTPPPPPSLLTPPLSLSLSFLSLPLSLFPPLPSLLLPPPPP